MDLLQFLLGSSIAFVAALFIGYMSGHAVGFYKGTRRAEQFIYDYKREKEDNGS